MSRAHVTQTGGSCHTAAKTASRTDGHPGEFSQARASDEGKHYKHPILLRYQLDSPTRPLVTLAYPEPSASPCNFDNYPMILVRTNVVNTRDAMLCQLKYQLLTFVECVYTRQISKIFETSRNEIFYGLR